MPVVLALHVTSQLRAAQHAVQPGLSQTIQQVSWRMDQASCIAVYIYVYHIYGLNSGCIGLLSNKLGDVKAFECVRRSQQINAEAFTYVWIVTKSNTYCHDHRRRFKDSRIACDQTYVQTETSTPGSTVFRATLSARLSVCSGHRQCIFMFKRTPSLGSLVGFPGKDVSKWLY